MALSVEPSALCNWARRIMAGTLFLSSASTWFAESSACFNCFEGIWIASERLAEHCLGIRRALLCEPQFSHFQEVHGALRPQPLQVHQIRFRSHGVAQIHARGCVIEI